VIHFKDRRHSLKEIGAALGATAVLDGSVRRAGDRVRIVAQLLDAGSDEHLWSETFDRSMEDIFTIQSEVAVQIASALRAELTADERKRVRRVPTADLHAYHLFLQGRRWHARYTTQGMLGAADLYDRALARDPNLAIAHAMQGMLHAELAEMGVSDPEVTYARAEQEVMTALRLDPDLDMAHATLAFIKGVRDYEWDACEREFERALELNPSNAEACDLYGRLCAGIGRFDRALDLLERAGDLDPLVHRIDIVTTLLRAGRIDEAIARGETALDLDPHERGRATLGWAYFLAGRREEGLEQLELAVSIAPDTMMWVAQLGEAHGLAGNEARAREILQQLEQRSRESYVPPYSFAYVYTGLGDAERAMDYLERAVAQRAGPAYSIKGSFLLAPLREHPRFQALLRKMKLL
jgi:tetratricopeptide (TPR) repeat protein